MPHERFKLSILAEARGDKPEAERLKETCPRKTYIMDEAGYRERWQAAFALVSGLAGATGVPFGWLPSTLSVSRWRSASSRTSVNTALPL